MNNSESLHNRLSALHSALGIPDDYSNTCSLPLCEEPTELVDTEADFYGRPQRLTPDSFASWAAMKQAAAEAEVTIFLI